MKEEKREAVLAMRAKSLWLFGDTSGVRQRAMACVTHPWFDPFILVCILLSSLLLGLEDPVVCFWASYRGLVCLFA